MLLVATSVHVPEVAIKVLPGSVAQDPARLARFEREAKVLAQLSHPSVASVFGFDLYEGTWFLVMECVEGVDLAQREGVLQPSGEAELLLFLPFLADHDSWWLSADGDEVFVLSRDREDLISPEAISRVLPPFEWSTLRIG